MASLCKKQQCTIDRRGFRQELDSWRHKLIHCVGFESILEGLIGPELVEDLKLLKDLKPVGVSDWSFDENCLFCCLRRDKVKEHLIGLNKDGLKDSPKPLLIKDQITISRLEKQAEEFLNAVLYRKDVPSFSDPHIPVVAREILQKMISQFAAEYTSKTSPPQDSLSDSPPHSDQSLPTPPLLSGAPSSSPAAILAGAAHNPVLSKLLMADQDAPLDLTIKKPLAEPTEQDGVLDLSIKKNRCSSLSFPSPCPSPATSTIKGESPDTVTKTKDLQSSSTLKQFMAKLCLHHQRQIIDSIGFLQSEVKAHASSNTQKTSLTTSGMKGSASAATSVNAVTPEKQRPELRSSSRATTKTEFQEMSCFITNSRATKKSPEKSPSLKISAIGTGGNKPPVSPTAVPLDGKVDRPNEHAPLKMKIMTSNGTGKKLSCVLNTLSSQMTLPDEKQGYFLSPSKTETHGARLSSSVKRFSPNSQGKQKETHAKDTSEKVFPVHITIPPDSVRTARKTIRGSTEHLMRDSVCKPGVDPDFGRCDIVFIDKPITECFKDQRRGLVPRRNARKSTRGHMYSDEIWELKTVRTLAGRGNCPNPMQELITLITPKQSLSKPDAVPPVDMPFVGGCREKLAQPISQDESAENVTPVEVTACTVDLIETSQTDQSQTKEQNSPTSPTRCQTESQEIVLEPSLEENTTELVLGEIKNVVCEPTIQALGVDEPESKEVSNNGIEPTKAESDAEQLSTTEKAPLQPPSNKLDASEPIHQAGSPTTCQVEEDEEKKKQDEDSQEVQPVIQKSSEDIQVTEEVCSTSTADEPIVKKIADTTAGKVEPVEKENKDDEGDSSPKPPKTPTDRLSSLRKKKVGKLPHPKSPEKLDVIVGYVNGKPVSASDRSLRHRAGSNPTSPSEKLGKSKLNTPEKTQTNPTIDSNVENKKREKSPEKHSPVKSSETTSATPEVELSPVTPSSLGNKLPPKTKQTRRQKINAKALQSSPQQASSSFQNTPPKRQLRSTSQKTLETPTLSLSPKPLSSVPSPDPSALTLPSAKMIPTLLPFSPLLTSSPLVKTSDPLEESPQSTAPETVKIHVEEAPPSKDMQTNEQETESEPKVKKLRSARVVLDSNKVEKQTSNNEVSNSENIEQTLSMPLRSKRIRQKESEGGDVLIQMENVDSLEVKTVSQDDSSSLTPDRPTRMPLRSETSRVDQSTPSVVTQSPVTSKKPVLRSQKSATPSTSATAETSKQNEVASPVRILPERITKVQAKPSSALVPLGAQSSHATTSHPKHEPPKQMPNKFFETLTKEESQHLITNLNIKFDKMQKGWVQMDKEGQPVVKYRNKSDRQAAIWKSKRRTRKPKSSEQQKYSPVQMLFMKGFSLSSICRWFLESTETKSLVIVKKVNTRLPSETQLCFHSSSHSSGMSQGVFPSLQAERLKKHLKKFAIASPVKSNPKSQKLIAKALEQEPNTVKGKEKPEVSNQTQTVAKAYSSAKASAQTNEPQKSSTKSKNPASARILRKYSNIKKKMQVQQTTARMKSSSKMLKSKQIKKPLSTTKSAGKATLKPSLKGRKPALAVRKSFKESAAKLEKRKILAETKSKKHLVKEPTSKVQSNSKASKESPKKETPKRCSQRLVSPKLSEPNLTDVSKNKLSSTKDNGADKGDVEKSSATKVSLTIQTKEPSQTPNGRENTTELPQQSPEVKPPVSTDQVLTRNKRKMEAEASLPSSPIAPSKRSTKSTTQNPSPKPGKKVDEPALTRSSVSKRHQTALLPRTATKRAQELIQTPAKRTRLK